MNDLVPSRGRTGVGDAALFFNARRHEDGCNIFQKCENEPQQEAGFIPDGHQTAAKLPGPTSFRPRHLFAASQLRKNLPHNLPGDIKTAQQHGMKSDRDNFCAYIEVTDVL